jgi:long-subunit fatty acid transport protein
MKKNVSTSFTKSIVFVFFVFLNLTVSAQQTPDIKPKNDFWKKVQFGGGIGLGIGSGFTNISVSPTAIYNINQYFSTGFGVQYSYLKQRDLYSSSTYGGSIIGLAQPIPEIQVSLELEQLRVNLDYANSAVNTNNFWNTGLFVGAGYRMNNITIGARYNLLFQADKGVYGDALIPFVRVFF